MALDDAALDALFRNARTHSSFSAEPVADVALKALYELTKMGPTSANCSPARFLFIRTPEGKALLRPCLSGGNIEPVAAAPVTVVVAFDPQFYLKLPELYPGEDVKPWFSGNPDLAEETAMRNSSLQGAYFMLAARAMGFATGAMSGFDRAKLDRAFFIQKGWRSNFLINIGYPVPGEELPPRLPRLGFEEAAEFA
ncbi:MAG: malonic semialdehyde reductase [Rhodospirillales bacterium]|nr:malonic semialdehyde reductase [Rhodospirillales bacterium]